MKELSSCSQLAIKIVDDEEIDVYIKRDKKEELKIRGNLGQFI
jgi:hypothetical protein